MFPLVVALLTYLSYCPKNLAQGLLFQPGQSDSPPHLLSGVNAFLYMAVADNSTAVSEFRVIKVDPPLATRNTVC